SRENNILYRFTVDRRGTISTRQKLPIIPGKDETISTFAINETAVFAGESGNLFMAGLTANQQSRLFQMTQNFQTRITEIAANNSSIAFLTEDGSLCFIPQDFKLIKDNDNFSVEKTRNITRITAIAPFSDKGNKADPYILWQNANIQTKPAIVYSDFRKDELSLQFIIDRSPIRLITSRGGNLLAVDSSGRLSVCNLNNISAKADFSFSSVGINDAGFVNDDYLLLCRSAINGSSPFLLINYNTGETVPVSYTAQAGILTYTGDSG
ncbi:hypothetical protein, partial [Treponema sp. R6D11]